jgi:hypothetical protein
MSAMNFMQVVNRPAPRTETRNDPRTTAPRAERVTQNETAQDANDTEPKAIKPRIDKGEFAQLLALLSGQGNSVRADLVKQLPEEGASLVDALLDGALLEGALPEGALPADDGSDTTAIFPGGKGLQQAIDARGLLADRAASAEAEEALRNGLLKLPREDRGDVVDLAAYARAREARLSGSTGLAGIAGAVVNATNKGNDSALDALTRVAARRGASLEQLLAVGDARGADARAALDALLSQAGTPAGRQIADAAGGRKSAQELAQQILSETDGSLLAGDGTNDEAARTPA